MIENSQLMIYTSMNHHIILGTNIHLISSARSDAVLIVLSLFAIFVVTTLIPIIHEFESRNEVTTQ